MEPVTYVYKLKFIPAVLGAVFFGAIASWFFHDAGTNQRGVLYAGFIHLSPGVMNGLAWMLGISMAFFCVVCILNALLALFVKRVVEMHTDRIRVPHGMFLRKVAEIPFAEIVRVEKHEGPKGHGRRLVILHGDRAVGVSAALLPDSSELDEIYAVLSSRLRRIAPVIRPANR